MVMMTSLRNELAGVGVNFSHAEEMRNYSSGRLPVYSYYLEGIFVAANGMMDRRSKSLNKRDSDVSQ